MFPPYWNPPKIQGRPLDPFWMRGGKRHYWGERGKNYGFYTTPDQQQMDKRRKDHRRIKSEAHNYQDDISKQLNLPSTRRSYGISSPTNILQRRQRFTTIGVQYQSQNRQKKDVAVEATLNFKQKLEKYVENSQLSRREEQIKKQLPNTNLPSIHQENEYLSHQQNNSFSQKRHVRFLSQPKVINQEQESQRPVVYYRKPNRQVSPTFCNSLGYPLPCYRYVY